MDGKLQEVMSRLPPLRNIGVELSFLDHLLQEFNNRFYQLNLDAIKGLYLIPDKLSKLSDDNIDTIYERPSPTFHQEIRRWKMLWTASTKLPSTLSATLTSSACVPKSYSNIATILHILSITP